MSAPTQHDSTFHVEFQSAPFDAANNSSGTPINTPSKLPIPMRCRLFLCRTHRRNGWRVASTQVEKWNDLCVGHSTV
jgi:hypothetical protein